MFAKKYGPWALVAGASEGIGAAFCEQLAQAGIHLIMVARRVGPLEQTAERLRKTGVEVVTVSADLGDEQVAERLAPHLEGREVGLMVYNACASTIGPFVDTTEASKLASIQR